MGFWKQTFKFLLWVAVIGAAVLGVVKYFFMDAYVVGHDAMAPTMITGEKVLAWRTSNIEFGDIAVCENPSSPGSLVMGRLVGTRAGQVIGSNNGRLQIADRAPDVDWSGATTFLDARTGTSDHVQIGSEHLGSKTHEMQVREHYRYAFRNVTLKEGEGFLLSDYRNYLGQDSRSFGPVSLATCRARVFVRLEAADDHGAGLGHGRLEFLK